jgi:hypothetical protein
MSQRENARPVEGATSHLKKRGVRHLAGGLAQRASRLTAARTAPEPQQSQRDGGRIQSLLRGSIISSPLAYPDSEVGGLIYESANGGEWLGFDFRRPTESPDKPPHARHQLWSGNLYGIRLDEIEGNAADHQTSAAILDQYSLDDVLRHTSRMSMEALVEIGFVAPTTYESAYKAAGLSEQHGDDLRRRGLTDELVHTVTPKGNRLVVLLPSSLEDSTSGLDDFVVPRGFNLA